MIILNGTVSACTGFIVEMDDVVLVGNNEDCALATEPVIWFYPYNQDYNTYGRLVISCKWPYPFNGGYSSFSGLNDQGLFFDCFSHPPLIPVNSTNKPSYFGDLIGHCLSICATVDEVLEEFDKYNLEYMHSHQIFIADKNGNSAIIEGDEVILKNDYYQVVTNFLQSNPEHGWYPCWRYDTAVSMIENMDELSVEYFASICDATHQEELWYPTIYSNICDLNNQIMYLYFMQDYENPYVINLEEELSQGRHSYFLPSLFEPENNQNPEKPNPPIGPSSGRPLVDYTFTVSARDPEEDQVSFLIDWGDNTVNVWTGPFDSDASVAFTHQWSQQDNYVIRVKARDIYGKESDWSEPIEISVPKNRIIDYPIISWLFERLPILELLFS
jgi:choloylglycine hydrolase